MTFTWRKEIRWRQNLNSVSSKKNNVAQSSGVLVDWAKSGKLLKKHKMQLNFLFFNFTLLAKHWGFLWLSSVRTVCSNIIKIKWMSLFLQFFFFSFHDRCESVSSGSSLNSRKWRCSLWWNWVFEAETWTLFRLSAGQHAAAGCDVLTVQNVQG